MSKPRFSLMIIFIIFWSSAVVSKTLADSLVTGFWNTMLLMQYNGQDDNKHKVVDKSIFFGRPLVSATTTQRPCEYGYVRDNTGTCIRIFHLDEDTNSMVNLNVILHNFGYGSDSDYYDDDTTEEEENPGERFHLDLPLNNNVITDSLEEIRNLRERHAQPLANQKDQFKLSTKSTLDSSPVTARPSIRFATTKLPVTKYSTIYRSVTQPAVTKSTTAIRDFTTETAIRRPTRTRFVITKSTTTERAIIKSTTTGHLLIETTMTEPAIIKPTTTESTITKFIRTKSAETNPAASKIKTASRQNANWKLYEYSPKVSFVNMSFGNASLKNSKKIRNLSSSSSEQTKRKELYLNPTLFHGDSIEVDFLNQKSKDLLIKNEIDPISVTLLD